MSRLLLKLSPFIAILGVYLSLLSKHLQTRHPTARPRSSPSVDEYATAHSYHDIDMLKVIPRTPTHTGYAIIGGSGFLGTYLTRLLLLRGETNIRIIDLNPPSDDILAESAVSFVRTDITSLPSVRAALSAKFPRTGEHPTVIYHMAATIRFWERASYTWTTSYKINVQGTANILAVALELPAVRSLIYTSSGDAVLPRPHHWTLGYSRLETSWKNVTRSDEDDSLPEAELSEACYSRTKRMAENLVKTANGKGNLRTGILRPAYTITGPNDRLISSALNMHRVPIFDKVFSQTPVNVWDVAAAHLLYEDALENKPEEVGGDAFLVTGADGEAWTLENIRNAIKHYSARPLLFHEVPPLAIFITAHILELFFYVRWHSLLAIYSIFGRQPSLYPEWMGEIIYLQPATLEYLADVAIDDSRAQKVLGYRPQWSVLQTIKYVVDKFDSGEAGSQHGMQLRKIPDVNG